MGCGDSTPRDNKPVDSKPNDIPEFKVVVIGDSSVGKTALIHQYLNS
jgi:hypothetical protein